jgi:S1-C subfamily serine protease
VGTRSVKDLVGQIKLPVSDGLMILQVTPNGSAAGAGLRGLSQTPDGELVLGDVITAVDNEKVSDTDDLYRLLDKRQLGDVVNVEVFRNGRRVTVPVRLVEAPDQRRGLFRR